MAQEIALNSFSFLVVSLIHRLGNAIFLKPSLVKFSVFDIQLQQYVLYCDGGAGIGPFLTLAQL